MTQESQIVGQDDKTVEIRPAQADDMDGLLTIEQQCFNVAYYAFYTFDRRDFEFYLEDPESLFLVAMLDNRLVGYVLGPIETWHEPPAAHIDSIAVLPDSQHKGVGARLMESFMELTRRQNCQVITLEVSPANEVGMAFFAKYGFRKVHRLRNYYGKGLHGLLLAALSKPQA
ncbi:MAG: GNAT family N-acetyltransferase [Phycisphaerales bacterium]